MTNYKKIFITGFIAFTALTSSALAATGSAEKALNSTSPVKSVSIQGNGMNGTHYTNVTGGTGSGWSTLYEFKRFWPDSSLHTPLC